MAIFNAFSGILTVFSVALLGYVLARGKRVSADMANALPLFVTRIALPPYLLRTVTTTLERDQLVHLARGAFLPFLSISLAFALALLLVRLLKIARRRQGIFCTAFATSNAMNIGLPINVALFGEVSLPYVLLYFFANVFFFWTVGNYAIARDGEGPAPVLFSLDTVKRIFSPPLVGFCAGIALVFFDLRLPAFIDKAFFYIGGTTVGLVLIYLGIMLHNSVTRNYRLGKDVIAVMAGRFLVSPLIVVLLARCVDIPVMMRDVFIIQSSLPVMINVLVLSGHYKADPDFSAMVVSITTFFSIFAIPVYYLILHP